MTTGSLQWPPYIQPQPGHEIPVPPGLHMPVGVVDIFSMQGAGRRHPERILVLACLGGGLMVVPTTDIHSLPATIQAQIRAIEINQRHQFRTIHAQELWIATLDAIEQEQEAQGYNDAVVLYSRMQAQCVADGRALQIQPLANESHLLVGRLDVLYGWRLGFAAPFRQGEEQILHCLVPAAPCQMIQQGRGMVLCYPVLDPARFSNLDNVPTVLQIIYDLLAQLQHDLVTQQHADPMTRLAIPVPSRHALEQALAADGYTIRGETAIRQSTAGRHDGSPSLLTRLRAWANNWSATTIALPPQATIPAYQAIIDTVLQAITTPADWAMMHAMLACVAPPATAPAPQLPAARSTSPTPAPSCTTPPSRQPPRRPNTTTWVHDFSPPPPRVPAEESWWQDFERSSPTPTPKTRQRSPGSAAPAQKDSRAALSSWASDFETKPPPPESSGEDASWKSDFD